MGKGVDLIRNINPEHAAAIDNFKDQLLIVLIQRFGGEISIPVQEVDGTGGLVLKMSVKDENFNFIVDKKH